MNKRFLLVNTAVAALIALIATVLSISPVVGQVGTSVADAASDDTAFAEPGEAVDIDVVANDGGMDDFAEFDPALVVVEQPAGGFLSVVFDDDGIAVLLFSANVDFGGKTTGKYRACWGDSCDNAEVTVYVGGEACTVVGTSGPDELSGTSGDDVICGLGGKDTIDGKGGNDLIFGGNGADTLRGSGGADEIYGGRGNDTILGGSGNDKLFGRKGADTISGNGGADEIHGNRGQDTISGGNGNDSLFGGRGRDTINGGKGNDTIRGRRGNDKLRGNDNDDDLRGGRGVDDLRGHAGNDTLNGGKGDDTLNGGSGTDICLKGETVRNCEDAPVEPVDDLDGDGIPDSEDPDIDGDGILNDDDAFPRDPAEDTDTDGDGTGNNADTDDDDDTYADDDDAFPLDPLEWLDTDGDGTGNNADLDDDGDGIPDVDDPDPLVPNDLTDSDGDGIPDAIDPDIDGDGIPNELDAFPNDPNESADTDGDGIPDGVDPDADNDGVPNDEDAFPFDDGETVDSDGGGLGDNADPDDDDDGVFDDVDVFPNDGTEWEDTDGDGTGNNADTDDDNDTHLDTDDAFPLDPNEHLDTDFDGIGDNADTDDDNDGVLDVDDVFPLDSLISKDTDGDGIGDLLDDDNDNDGARDLADVFPNDPAEQLDTDLDGIGNNADTDDDNDTFVDGEDAFPLDPTEWSDFDGNGVGDNADLVADLDGDGVPDGSDPDIDGDLVDNGDDAFPYNPTEWVDSDGDGIGDSADADDDDDGVPDEQDLLPNDPNVGTDSDGDGTPDTYDLDPNSADEPRFQVETAEPSGAATTIVSDGLILQDEVVITEEPVDAEDGIANVAASEIVDFTIDGPFTDFETARITIPIDPILAAQPDPVEVWWFNEEYGLWVPDGTDLQVDAANATVSVTVDHFSTFIALRKGSTPALVPPANYLCSSTGIDAVFLVDASGSTQYSYIESGDLRESTDPLSDVSLTRREIQVQGVVRSLVGGRDRVALIGFGEATQLSDFSSADGGVFNIGSELRSIIQTPASGTSITNGLDDAYDLLTGAESSGRAGAIIVISDGRFDSLPDMSRFLEQNIAVHAMSIGPGSDSDVLDAVAFEGGGVSVPFPADGSSEAEALSARLAEAAFIDRSDSDQDLLTNCEETEGIPLVDGIVWASDVAELNDAAHNSDHWLKTSALNRDSDGDLLWDSEEVTPIDIASVEFLSEPYRLLLDAGFTRVFSLRADPNDPNSPFIDSNVVDPAAIGGRGEIEDGYRPSRGSITLQNRKLSRLSDVDVILAEILDSDNHPRAGDEAALVVEKAALQWATGQAEVFGLLQSAIFAQRPGAEDAGVSPGNAMPAAWNEFDRLQLLFGNESAVLNRLAGLNDVELALIAEIEQLEDLREVSTLSDEQVRQVDFYRLQLTRELMESLERFTRYRSRFAPGSIDESVALLEQLRSNYYYRADQGDPDSGAVSMDVATAYRLIKMFYQNEVVADPDGGFQPALQGRVKALEELLGIENGVAKASFDGLRRSLAEQGQDFTKNDFEQLTLEALAGGQEQFDRAIELNRPRTPFLTEDQEVAVEFVREQFVFGGTADVLTVQFVPEDGLVADLPRMAVNSGERGLVWRDFEQVLVDAQLSLGAGEPPRLTSVQAQHVANLFDDIARSDLLNDGWREKEEFGNGKNRDPSSWRSLSLRDFGDEAFNGQVERVLSDPFYELHPGIVTESDLARFDVFLLARELLATRSSIIDGISSDGEVDGIINSDDVEKFLEIFRDIDNISQTEAEFIIQVARGEGLVDDNFDLNDIVNILGWLGLGLAAAGGIVVLSGGSAALATKLFAASALAEVPVVPIKLYQGDFAAAGASTLLILADGDQIARAFTRTVERAGPALKIAKFDAGLGDIAGDFADFGFGEVNKAIKLRGDDVVASQGGDLAYARFKIIRDIEADLRPLTATPQQAEFLAKRYFDDLLSRLDDRTAYDEAIALFNANPAAADAYVRWGNKVFDPIDGPKLIEFAHRCGANPAASAGCGKLLDADETLQLASFESALASSDLTAWVKSVEDVGGDEAIELVRLVAARNSTEPAAAQLIASNARESIALTRMAAATEHLDLVLSNPNHAADVANRLDELEYIVGSGRADLAWDLSGSQRWRYRELETALFVESKFAIRLSRAQADKSFDFVDEISGISYDGVEPVGKFFEAQWNAGNIQNAIRNHIETKAMRVPVNVADLSRVSPGPGVPSQFDRVKAYVEAQPDFPENVFLVGD